MNIACAPNPSTKPFAVEDPAIVLKSGFRRAGAENEENKKKREIKKKGNNKKREREKLIFSLTNRLS